MTFHFPEPYTNVDNTTIIVEVGALPNPSEIASFDENGNCVGRAKYDGEKTAFAVAEYTEFDDQEKGLRDGDPFGFRVWDGAEEYAVTPEFEPCEEGDSLCEDENVFTADALYTLEGVQAAEGGGYTLFGQGGYVLAGQGTLPAGVDIAETRSAVRVGHDGRSAVRLKHGARSRARLKYIGRSGVHLKYDVCIKVRGWTCPVLQC